MKAWLAEAQRGKVKVTVDGKSLGYGKDNAISLTEDQLERAKAVSDAPIQTDASGSDSGSTEGESGS